MKTLCEFDYDLWAIVDNGKKRYFVRIKATGEETEITLDVMRLLLSQEKQMRREYAKRKTVGTVLSLEAICDEEDVDDVNKKKAAERFGSLIEGDKNAADDLTKNS